MSQNRKDREKIKHSQSEMTGVRAPENAGISLESARGDSITNQGDQSVRYQATDGTPYDLGDKEAVDDDEQSNSEEGT